MRISPEPLHPLRCWRELWQSEPAAYNGGFQKQDGAGATVSWKQPKRGAAFQWFAHFFQKDANR